MIAQDPETKGLEPWQKIQAAKKAEQNSRIPEDWKLKDKDFPPASTVDLRPVAVSCGILSEKELLITSEEYDATSLAASVAAGKYTAEEVATAFCKRAAIGHQLCNNLTEIMFQDAIEDAKRLDKIFSDSGKTIGPLHGLPMTFKARKMTTDLEIKVGVKLTFGCRNASMSKDTTPVTVTSPGPSTRQRTTHRS